MKRYMLLPEDSIELLRAQDEAEAAVCVFCERTMILFPCSKIEAVSIQRSVTEEKSIETDSWWQGHAKTDPQGSWTGKPADPMETPVQDADDL